MARIKDIARMAGVSEATVSRVLNKTARVSRETEKKVLSAVKKSKYRPNKMARGLRQKDGRLIGLLVPEIHHPTFSEIAAHVEHFARLQGLNLMLGGTGSNSDTESRIINDMVDRNANGIIALRVSNRSHAAEVLEKYSIPFILLDRAELDSSFPYVMTDNVTAGRMAARYLFDRGHRNIACLTGPREVTVAEMRLSGFKDELRILGGVLTDANIFEGDFSFEGGRKLAELLIRQSHPATVIWAQNDPMALGIVHQYMRAGQSVPGDISVMGMDDIAMAAQFIPGLTTISQPFREMCRLAVEFITDQEGGHNKQSILSPGLVERDSVGRI